MCNEQAQKQYADHGTPGMSAGYIGGDPNVLQSPFGSQTSAAAPPGKLDPMWMPLQVLLNEWHRQAQELSYLRIELANQKARVAELERDCALRIG